MAPESAAFLSIRHRPQISGLTYCRTLGESRLASGHSFQWKRDGERATQCFTSTVGCGTTLCVTSRPVVYPTIKRLIYDRIKSYRVSAQIDFVHTLVV